MDPTLVFMIVALVVGSGGYLWTLSRLRAQAAGWRHAAMICGLTSLNLEKTEVLGWPRRLVGRRRTLRVCFERYDARQNNQGTRLVIDGLGLDSDGLALRPETIGTNLQTKLLGHREIEIGDADFDDALFVQGSPATVRALLDAETRLKLRGLFRGTIATVKAAVQLRNGRLSVDIPETFFGDELQRLSLILDDVLRVAERLVRPDDVAARLAANVQGDPLPAVRLNNLLTLIGDYPEHTMTRETLRAACEDESDEIRLRAGIALGWEGHDVLLEIVSREAASDACAAKAVTALSGFLPIERARTTLAQALAVGRPKTALACVQNLARGSEGAEASLIEALKQPGMAMVRVAAANALGRVGTVETIPHMREVGERYPNDLELHRAMGPAIAAIKSRLVGASPGQLSLTEGSAGQLSMTEGVAGRLSVPSDEQV